MMRQTKREVINTGAVASGGAPRFTPHQSRNETPLVELPEAAP